MMQTLAAIISSSLLVQDGYLTSCLSDKRKRILRERKRRSNIRMQIKRLQRLLPDSNCAEDAVSVMASAADYIEALKQQACKRQALGCTIEHANMKGSGVTENYLLGFFFLSVLKHLLPARLELTLLPWTTLKLLLPARALLFFFLCHTTQS